MKRLYIVVEGATEERFCKVVLAPHFAASGAMCIPMQVRRAGARGGGRSWQPWERHLRTLLRQQRGRDVLATTMLDLYGVPRDAPGFDPSRSGLARADAILLGMAEQMADPRFIPNVLVHEFEALVFAALDQLALIGVDESIRARLAAEAAPFASPEDIDDGYETSPARRIVRHVHFYDKVAHGSDVTAACGLEALRTRCPRFAAWLTRLENALR